MPSRLLKVIVAISAIAALASCSKRYVVVVSQDGGEVFITIRSRAPAPGGVGGPCVTGFGVMEREGSEIWAAEPANGCERIARFRYGEVPPGWKMRGTAPDLQPGREYRVVVGAEDGLGTAIFRYEGRPIPTGA